MKSFLVLFSILFLNTYCHGQNKDLEKKHTSEIVILKDLNLKNLIQKILKKNQSEETKYYSWYLDFNKNESIIISQYNIENLIASKEITNIYSTFINDEILFIISKENISSVFSKTKYSIDLSSFIDKSDFTTIDSPFWILQKDKNNNYQIIKEKKYKQ